MSLTVVPLLASDKLSVNNTTNMMLYNCLPLFSIAAKILKLISSNASCSV